MEYSTVEEMNNSNFRCIRLNLYQRNPETCHMIFTANRNWFRYREGDARLYEGTHSIGVWTLKSIYGQTYQNTLPLFILLCLYFYDRSLII